MRVKNILVRGVNLGDLAASPLDYYDIPDAEKLNFADHYISDFENSLVLVGGGGLLFYEDRFRNIRKGSNKIVGWGIGFNKHWKMDHPHDYDLVKDFDLVGIRNFDVDFEKMGKENGHSLNYQVPCVSCKHPAFDEEYPIQREIGVYEHMVFPINLFPGKHRISNCAKAKSMEEAIRFLGESKKIVTSSYHGAYWGSLLGREVYINRAFSQKFRDIPGTRIVLSADEVRSGKVKAVPGFLQDCRRKNDDFFRIFTEIRESWSV